MKKVIKTMMLLSLMMFCFSITRGIKAEAAVLSNIELLQVDDLDNTPYPDTSTVMFEYLNESYVPFTIDSPGQVKAFFRCEIDSQTSGNVWISTDKLGNDIIGDISKFSGGETEVSWFLESGTYYMYMAATHHPYEVNLALLFEKSKVIEKKTSTSFLNPTIVKLNETAKGFLSNTNPNDYYSFEVKEKSNVTIKYMFDDSKKGTSQVGSCTLYDKNEVFLKEGSYKVTDKGLVEFNYLLEPGYYYIKLQGLYGSTALQIVPMYYDITLTADTNKAWTKKAIEVNIDTSIDYSDIVVLFKDVKETLVDKDSVWKTTNPDYVVLDGETFLAKESGTYSVRITDRFGNHSMKKIKISNVDITKPVIKGVTSNKYYKKPVTITWSDKHSGIDVNKTTLNGKKVSSGTVISKEGKYTLKVYDKVGNYVTRTFTLDHTAPTAGVENGKTYKEAVNLKIRDNISGIKKIMVDGMEITTSGNTYYCYMNGEYIVELWDNAGNYRKLTFHVKKDY